MEEKTYTLTVTEQEINIISAGLGELPHKIVAPLIVKLQQQINNQIGPTLAPLSKAQGATNEK